MLCLAIPFDVLQLQKGISLDVPLISRGLWGCSGLLWGCSGALWTALERHAPGVLAAPAAAAAAAATASAGATAPLDFPRISKRISFNSLQISKVFP